MTEMARINEAIRFARLTGADTIRILVERDSPKKGMRKTRQTTISDIIRASTPKEKKPEKEEPTKIGKFLRASPGAMGKPRATGLSKGLQRSSPAGSRLVVTSIMQYGARKEKIRFRYLKLTTGKWVYRTVEPYSLRLRNVRTAPGDSPSKAQLVLFGRHDYHYEPASAGSKEKTGIEMYLVKNINWIKGTGRTFTPFHNWPVEFSLPVKVREAKLGLPAKQAIDREEVEPEVPEVPEEEVLEVPEVPEEEIPAEEIVPEEEVEAEGALEIDVEAEEALALEVVRDEDAL